MITPSPASGHARMPQDLRALFDRAFESRGLARPSAGEWQATLEPYARRSTQRMVVCAQDATHQHYAGMACAQCDRAQLLQKARAAKPAAVAPRAATTARPGVRQRPQPGVASRPPPRLPPVFFPQPTPRANPWMAILRFLGVRGTGAVLMLLFLLLTRGCAWLEAAVRPHPTALEQYDAFARVQERMQAQVQAREVAQAAEASLDAAPPTPPDNSDTTDWVRAYASIAGEYSADLSSLAVGAPMRAHPAPAASPASIHAMRDAIAAVEAQGPVTWAAREQLKADLADLLARDPGAAEVAFELGRMQLVDGERDAAMHTMTAAVDAAPAQPAAWYGLALVLSPQVQDTYGALSIAEILSTDRARSESLRARAQATVEAMGEERARDNDARVLSRFAAPRPDRPTPDFTLDARRFAAILARARVRVATLRGDAVPADVTALAARPLPR